MKAAVTGHNRSSSVDTAVIAALALAQAVVVAVVIAIGAAPAGGAPPIAYAFAVASGAVVLAAQRLPIVALVAGIGLVIAYYIVNLPAIGVGIPILGTVYLASLAGHLAFASISATMLVALSTVFRAFDGDESTSLIAYDTVTNLALIAATVALAAMVRARRAGALQQQRMRELERHAFERERDDERLQIARDLHDSLGHQLVTASVYAGVAAEALDDDARSSALRQVQEATRSALDELRTAVRAVRAGSVNAPTVDAAGAAETAATALRSAGIAVTSHVDPSVGDLPVAVQQSAVRIVQEACTNILKHSHADRAALDIERANGLLLVRISDNGTSASPGAPASGIGGMRDRATELGGTLDAQMGRDGFVVEARLPERPTR